MSFAEIVETLPKLNRNERRELARRLFEFADEDAALLADSDRRADERFLMLDKLEANGETDSQSATLPSNMPRLRLPPICSHILPNYEHRRQYADNLPDSLRGMDRSTGNALLEGYVIK